MVSSSTTTGTQYCSSTLVRLRKIQKISPNGQLAVATTMAMIFTTVISIKLYSDRQYKIVLEEKISSSPA